MIKGYLSRLSSTSYQNYTRHLFEAVAGLNPRSMLDVGCYSGEHTLEIAKACGAKTVFGLEIDPVSIRKAKAKGIHVFQGNIMDERLSFKGKKFDFIYCNQVIEHLFSVDRFIHLIRKALAPGGVALVSTENLAAWHNVVSLALGYQPFSLSNMSVKKWKLGNPFLLYPEAKGTEWMIHRSMFTTFALKDFFGAWGYEVVKTIPSGYYPFPNNWIGNTLAKLDPRHSVNIAFMIKKAA